MNYLKITAAFKTFSSGVQFFVPENPAAYAAGKPCKGFGSVRYGEGSVYYGDLYFDGKRYNKLGFGRQDFMLSGLGAFDSARKLRKAFYIGNFDYRQTDWIYGDGVMYYVDGDNRPACFVKGFFEGTNKVAAYGGSFSYENLAEGFTADMESDFDDWHSVLAAMYAQKSGLIKLKNLFIGDSYFEFWRNTEFSGKDFYESFDVSENLNIGVGGTRFCDWIGFLTELKDIPHPERIFINLGFNDIHCNHSAERVYGDYLKVLEILKSRFANAEIYLLNIAKTPEMADYYQEEEKFNGMTENSADKTGVKIIDMRAALDGKTDVFYTDGVHLNPNGYKILTKKIKAVING